MTRPYWSDADGNELYHGDALDLIDEMACDGGRLSGSAWGQLDLRAVIMDPPYASGTRHEAAKPTSGAMLRAGRFADRPIDLDQMTTQGFVWLMRAVGLRAHDALLPGGSLLCFIDWRQWPNLVGALETCNYRVQGMVVWDKGSPGLGNGFRRQHELVCHASKGVPTIHDRSTSDVLAAPRCRPDHHPSPKPVELMERLLAVVTAPGDVVLDPFAGSGSTLVACQRSGRRFVGFERDETYCEVAAKRLEGVEDLSADPSQACLFAATADGETGGG